MKSVIINGDKSKFVGKASVDRFKKDLKNSSLKSNYFVEGWGHIIESENDESINVKIVELENNKKEGKNISYKNKLRELKNSRGSSNALMSYLLKNKVPYGLAESYIEIKNISKIPIINPVDVIQNPEKHIENIRTIISAFENNNSYNPYITYYRDLAKHLNISSKQVMAQQEAHKQAQLQKLSQSSYVDEFLKQKDKGLVNEMDNELKKIYNEVGLKSATEVKKEVDVELQDIYNQLGL